MNPSVSVVSFCHVVLHITTCFDWIELATGPCPRLTAGCSGGGENYYYEGKFLVYRFGMATVTAGSTWCSDLLRDVVEWLILNGASILSAASCPDSHVRRAGE